MDREEVADAGTVPPTLPLSRDLGRAFLYARYNPELDTKGLAAMGLGHLVPARVQRMDAVDQMSHLLEIGRAAGETVRLEHFGRFAQEVKA